MPISVRSILGGTAFAMSLPFLASAAHAADDQPTYDLKSAYENSIVIAQAEAAAAVGKQGGTAEMETPFEESAFTANKIHKYLGIGSLGLVGLALLAPKEDGNSLHHNLAIGAATLGVGAVATGLTFHYKDLNFKRLTDPDTVHALLGTLAAACFLAAVSEAPESGHPALGIAGTVFMLTAVKVTW